MLFLLHPWWIYSDMVFLTLSILLCAGKAYYVVIDTSMMTDLIWPAPSNLIIHLQEEQQKQRIYCCRRIHDGSYPTRTLLRGAPGRPCGRKQRAGESAICGGAGLWEWRLLGWEAGGEIGTFDNFELFLLPFQLPLSCFYFSIASQGCSLASLPSWRLVGCDGHWRLRSFDGKVCNIDISIVSQQPLA